MFAFENKTMGYLRWRHVGKRNEEKKRKVVPITREAVVKTVEKALKDNYNGRYQEIIDVLTELLIQQDKIEDERERLTDADLGQV